MESGISGICVLFSFAFAQTDGVGEHEHCDLSSADFGGGQPHREVGIFPLGLRPCVYRGGSRCGSGRSDSLSVVHFCLLFYYKSSSALIHETLQHDDFIRYLNGNLSQYYRYYKTFVRSALAVRTADGSPGVSKSVFSIDGHINVKRT